MSKFSVYLKSLIDESGKPISTIAREIGAERTSIHRALKDERILPYKVIRSLADYLQLSLEERQEFFRFYDMLLQGEDVWRNRTAVCDLLNQLSVIQFKEYPSFSDITKSLSKDALSEGLIEGEYSVQNMLYTLLSSEIAHASAIRFQMLLPFGTDLSAMLMRLWQIDRSFSVDQLFCFPTTVDNDCSQSVRILQQIIPLCLTARDSYHPYYFYERPGFLSVNPLNYYIITPHYLILLSQDQSAALIQRSDNLVRHFSDHFKSLIERCEPLASCATDMAELFDKSNSTIDPNGYLYMMSQPCFGRYYTPEIIGKYFHVQNCPTPGMFEAAVQHFALLQKVEKNFYTVFSEKGLQYFIETGIITEMPPEYIPPAEVEDRIYLLTRLRNDIADGKMTGLIARPSYLRLPEYLSISIDSDGNAHFDTTSAFPHGAFYCNIHISEKSICQAFRDFFQSLPGSQMVYSREDTLRMLDEGIRRLSVKNPLQG